MTLVGLNNQKKDDSKILQNVGDLTKMLLTILTRDLVKEIKFEDKPITDVLKL